MILHSTNGKAPKVRFAQAIANGIAPDGGLYVPDSFPHVPHALFRNIQDMSVREVGFVVMSSLFGHAIPAVKLKAIVDEVLDFPIPMRRVDESRYVLELFHGPTNSFKDIGARFMARLLPVFSPLGAGGHRNIIMATSGDSGGAVANAFSGARDTNVFVLFPKGLLSITDVIRFASFANVQAIEVDGTFDECQSLVRQALLVDAQSGTPRLTSGNSINPARELPAMIYFFYAYAQTVAATGKRDGVVISVPCGNLGSLAAALMAKRMGLPVAGFFAANNANDAFVEYLKTGGITPKKTLLTLARAMDVGNPSNLARIIDLYDGDLNRLRADVRGYAYSDEEISETIRETYRKLGEFIDPQGATALRAIERHLPPGHSGVALASGHPGNYPAAMTAATGETPDAPMGTRPSSSGIPNGIMRIPATMGALNRILNRFK